jgi:hypothetical protein
MKSAGSSVSSRSISGSTALDVYAGTRPEYRFPAIAAPVLPQIPFPFYRTHEGASAYRLQPFDLLRPEPGSLGVKRRSNPQTDSRSVSISCPFNGGEGLCGRGSIPCVHPRTMSPGWMSPGLPRYFAFSGYPRGAASVSPCAEAISLSVSPDLTVRRAGASRGRCRSRGQQHRGRGT